jgi:glycine betaine/proline transport system substrate-binding protein
VGWEGSINKDGSSNRNIKKLADDWIAANQAEFDGWVAQAMAGQ